jgi:hypothetical protein
MSEALQSKSQRFTHQQVTDMEEIFNRERKQLKSYITGSNVHQVRERNSALARKVGKLLNKRLEISSPPHGELSSPTIKGEDLQLR